MSAKEGAVFLIVQYAPSLEANDFVQGLANLDGVTLKPMRDRTPGAPEGDFG